VVALFKPQFEVGKSEVGKGGIVRDADVIERALDRFRAWCAGHGYAEKAAAPSEVTGAEGNREVFVHLEPVAA
jgi:23S rRNA (cytidine1920-2'-O)/16S rRNA (cytidine1409-2'-O)-methyltransferase